MSFTTEDKIARLKKYGWEIIEYPDTENNMRVNARYYEPIGRVGKKKTVPLYNLFFKNKNELVQQLYYSSVGLQKDLAKEFGLTPEEISYIKCGKSYERQDKKSGEIIKISLNAGKRVKWIEDVRFYLSQIDERVYTVQLRKENMDHEEWRKRINTLCSLLSKRTGDHYYVEYEGKNNRTSTYTIYLGDNFPICTGKLYYPEILQYLNSLLILTCPDKVENQLEIFSLVVNH